MRSPARPPRRPRRPAASPYDGTRAGSYALLTHSLPPSPNCWCFQIGTVAFSSLIRARRRQTPCPGARRRPPPRPRVRRRPARRVGARRQARGRRSGPLSFPLPAAQLSRGGRVGAVGEPQDSPVLIVIPDDAGEQGDASGGRVLNGAQRLVNGQLLMPQLGQPDHVHAAKLPAGPAKQVTSRHVARRRRRARRTIAAVPITATVAPAAPAATVASFLASRRPATARRPACVQAGR